jgi:hypothetical protein
MPARNLFGQAKASPAGKILLDFVLVFLLAAVLIRPYFKEKFTDKWASIESTFIADARYLVENWPHPRWQPLWYAGTRFDYIYPPALRYGTAAIAKVTGFWPVKAYHFYVSVLYAVGIAGVYLLLRIGSGSRGAAYLGAAAAALTSPSFLFLARFREDAWRLSPQRLGVLVRYGEGPHMSALAIIPITLAFMWLAFEKHRPWAMAAAAIATAAAVANNFYGATALAIFYPVLVWSFWITRRDKRILAPALAIPILAYGLSAFWLTPSYIRVTTENLKYVTQPGNEWSVWLTLALAALFAAATYQFARGKAMWTWGVFVVGSLLFFLLDVAGNYYFNFLVTGDPHRLVPELDMVCILAIVLGLRWMWHRPGMVLRGAAILLTAAGFWTARGYVRHAWEAFPAYPDYQNRVEFRIADWMWKNMPDARALPIGSVRFWYDAWHDLAQVGGGSEQGLENGQIEWAYGYTVWVPDPKTSILWMQAAGADAVYVSDKQSQEVYKDFHYPRKFDGVLPVLFDDRQGDVVYRVPRRYAPRVRVVETAKLNALQAPRSADDVASVAAYDDIIEKGPDSPATVVHEGPDAMRVHARLDAGQSVVVQESYDPAWHAWSDGKPLTMRKDAMGMMAIDAPPGDRVIILAFVTPFENQAGRALTAITLLLLAALVLKPGTDGTFS